MKMDSSEILKLLSHHIQHPKMQNMMKKYLITERWWENDKYDYTDHENTICLSFVNGKTFNKRYSLPLIGSFGNPLPVNEKTPKGDKHLFLKSISFRPGFKGNLPLGLSLNMDDIAISQILQAKPIGSSIRKPSLQALENGITCITRCMYFNFPLSRIVILKTIIFTQIIRITSETKNLGIIILNVGVDVKDSFLGTLHAVPD